VRRDFLEKLPAHRGDLPIFIDFLCDALKFASFFQYRDVIAQIAVSHESSSSDGSLKIFRILSGNTLYINDPARKREENALLARSKELLERKRAQRQRLRERTRVYALISARMKMM
jgi:hypothetical protein